MCRIIVAPDSYKESLSAQEAAASISQGIYRILPTAEVIKVPLSDGGEGLTQALVDSDRGSLIDCEVTGPLGKKICAQYGILTDSGTAVIEMAAASGLPLVSRKERNPMLATTYGTGELIKAALDTGCERIIIGIGGSATNDGGAGMAQALGVKMLDSNGREISSGAAGLLNLSRIDMSQLDLRLQKTEILVACDVHNPLYGPSGAAYVYGRQKGATPEMIPVLDRALRRMAEIIGRDLQLSIQDTPGAGAAGGLGAGLLVFTGGKLRSGLQLVFDILGFEDILAGGADLVITGEGGINGQSLYGKVPVGVAQMAKKFRLPVLCVVGSIGPGADKAYEEGIDAIMSIAPGPISLDESVAQASKLLADATSRALRMICMK